MYRLFLLSLLILTLGAASARGEIIWTLEGHAYDGITVLSVPHAITVTPTGGKPATVPYDHILLATLSAPRLPGPPPDGKPIPAGTVSRGILFKTGTFLAGAGIRNSDNKTALVVHSSFRGPIPLAQIARIIHMPLTPALAARINDRVGVLTNSGDFSEGEVSSIEPRQVKISSVVLGIAPFHFGGYPESACAVSLGKAQPEDARFIVTLVDGSTLLADTLECTANDQLLVTERALGHMRVHPLELFSIRASKDAATALTSLKPREALHLKDFRPAATSPFDLTSGGTVPAGASSALILPAAATVTYDLAGKYTTLLCRIGVPARVSDKATVRFTFLVDGKESEPPRALTKKDPLANVKLALTSAKSLTIKITSEDPAALGAIADPLLLPPPR